VSLVLLSTRGLCSVSVLDGTSRVTGWNILPEYWGAVITLPSLSDSRLGPLASRVTYLSWGRLRVLARTTPFTLTFESSTLSLYSVTLHHITPPQVRRRHVRVLHDGHPPSFGLLEYYLIALHHPSCSPPLSLLPSSTKLTLSETPSLPRCRRTSTPDRDLSNRNPSENKVPDPTTGVHSKKTEPTGSKQTTMPPTSKRSLLWKNEMIMSLLSPLESNLTTPFSTLLPETGM
jgi:hypothetical protein